MNELNKYLDTFNIIIKDLSEYQSNIKLGGTLILKTLGLNFSRPVGDLDLIIFNPTKEQETYLKALKASLQEEGSPGPNNFKFKKNGLYLNVLCVYFTTTFNTVFYEYNKVKYSLNLINEIIDAKKNYSRKKDMQDFLILKNENFNL